jgi:hypothetical protein
MKGQLEGQKDQAMKKHMIYCGEKVVVICGGTNDWWTVQRENEYRPFVVHKNELSESGVEKEEK